MKAIVKTERKVGAVSIVDVPKPKPARGQVLIKIKATAICGSDLHAWEYPPSYEWIRVPGILGHEYAGIIEEVGEGVNQFKVGDRVMGESNQYCGHCPNCHRGKTFCCSNNKMTGLAIDGGLAEYIAVSENYLHYIPENVSFAEAAVAQPCAVSFHGVFDNSKVRPGDTVVVSGPGIVGLMAAQAAKIMGASNVIVTGVTMDEEIRLPIARKMGFSVINVQEQDIKKELLALTGSETIDVAVECSGATQAIAPLLGCIRKGGAMTVLALYGKPVEINFAPLVRSEIHLMTSHTCGWDNYEQALKLISTKQVDIAPLMAVYPFDRGIEAFENALAKIVQKPVLILE